MSKKNVLLGPDFIEILNHKEDKDYDIVTKIYIASCSIKISHVRTVRKKQTRFVTEFNMSPDKMEILAKRLLLQAEYCRQVRKGNGSYWEVEE